MFDTKAHSVHKPNAETCEVAKIFWGFCFQNHRNDEHGIPKQHERAGKYGTIKDLGRNSHREGAPESWPPAGVAKGVCSRQPAAQFLQCLLIKLPFSSLAVFS